MDAAQTNGDEMNEQPRYEWTKVTSGFSVPLTEVYRIVEQPKRWFFSRRKWRVTTEFGSIGPYDTFSEAKRALSFMLETA